MKKKYQEALIELIEIEDDIATDVIASSPDETKINIKKSTGANPGGNMDPFM